MENKGRGLLEWSENHPAGQLQCGDRLGMLSGNFLFWTQMNTDYQDFQIYE
jgi:hypothetical protein